MRVLIVCTGNTCRSPMAGAFLISAWQQKGAGSGYGELIVSSAGLSTTDGLPASDQAIETMREEGIDISSHRSSILRDQFIKEADLVLTMTVGQCKYLRDRFSDQAHIYPLVEFTQGVPGEVFDPYGQGMESYRQTRSQLKYLAGILVNKIIEEKSR